MQRAGKTPTSVGRAAIVRNRTDRQESHSEIGTGPARRRHTDRGTQEWTGNGSQCIELQERTGMVDHL